MTVGAVVVGCGEPSVPEDIFSDLGAVAPYASADQQATFARGREVARHEFTIEEGLGPHFNLSSCTGCHERPDTGGSAARYRNFLLVQQRLSDGSQHPVGVNGIQAQFHVTTNRQPWDEEANIVATRNSIAFFGVGLIAELDEASILANADEDDADGDGISGRPNYDRGFVGRFGRKAQTVSIEGFIRGPLFNHLGLTSNPLSQERKALLPVPSAAPMTDSTTAPLTEDVGAVRAAQAAAPDMPNMDDDGVPDPELSEQDLFDLVSFAMLLGAPRPDEPTPETEEGHRLFDEIRCNACHVRGLTSPRGLIPLYSDLLLHDMGDDLADEIRMGIAEGDEFRTQPLWGVTAVGPYLHDGRADTLDEAIRLHGGESAAVRDAYVALSDEERGSVIAFLRSLGGRSQDSPGLIPPGAPLPPRGEYGCSQTELTGADAALFEAGRRVFDRDLALGAGLGPGFNGDSCRACHFLAAPGGAGPIDVNVTRQAMLDPTSGMVSLPATGSMAHRFLRDAMRPPIDPASNLFELRQTPPLFGLGLVDRIPEADIVANEDPDDLDGDGISGRACVLSDGRIGRLGWKANVPNSLEFARDALSNEMGVSLPPQAGLTFGNLTDTDGIADPEMTIEDLTALNFFLTELSQPPRQRTDPALEDQGEAIFATVGCDDCHRTMSLEDGTPLPVYSDLLLHDVYPDGFHGIVEGYATDRELRTTPLWGLSRSGPYMHDGRSATIEDAIARHFGEATNVVTAFTALSATDRAALLAFLQSL